MVLATAGQVGYEIGPGTPHIMRFETIISRTPGDDGAGLVPRRGGERRFHPPLLYRYQPSDAPS